MIPFLKKNKDGKKPPKPTVPHTAQESIPFQRMFEDGTCRVRPGYYTRTIQYQDINYQLAQQEDKTAIFEEWCSFLNFFDSSIHFELSFVNTATDSADFEKSIRIPYQQDGFDDVRAEYSQMLRQQLSKGNNGLTKTKFLTYGIEGDSMAQVKPRLEHIQNDLMNNFHRLGVLAKPLDGTERLRLMHGMLNMDGANKFHFNWKDLVPSGLSVKDAIAPTALAFKNSRTFQVGGIFGAVSFLNITASDLSDQLLKDFLDMDSSQIVTMHIQSVDQNKAIKTIKHTITELDRSKIEEQKKAVRAGYDMDVLPSDLATYGRDAKALLKELQSQNERINKRKHELYELHINEQEAAVVRIVFDKYVYEGYGPQHIATYLNNSGYRARSGKCWHPSSIRGMVQNLTYTGVLRCGDARSELMPDLQIVPQEQFENAQRIRNERSVRSTAEAENRLPLNIHGKSLLAGNAYCGHCGAKLELTSSRKWRKMADGSLDDTLRIRYTCYGKLRKQTNCTGQTGYTVHILDEIIDKAVRQIFSKMRGIPKEQIITRRYEREVVERKNHLQDLQTQRNKAEKDLLALKTEVLACIKGESVLPRETLAEMITAQEEKLTELENLCEAASEELEKTAELMDKVSRLYDELISYADLYDSANFEAKKMIVNQLIRRVDVYRGYQINISFNFDLTPYIEGE